MKPNDIKVGKTYTNKGAGRSRRTVLAMGDNIPVAWYGHKDKEPYGATVVRFRSGSGAESAMYLHSFAAWAGKEVEFPTPEQWAEAERILEEAKAAVKAIATGMHIDVSTADESIRVFWNPPRVEPAKVTVFKADALGDAL